MMWLASSEAVSLKGKYAGANWDVDKMTSRSREIIGDNTLLEIVLDSWPSHGRVEGYIGNKIVLLEDRVVVD